MRTYPEYELANDESNVISLVEIICKIYYQHNHKLYKPQTIIFSVMGLMNCLQHDSSNIDYFKKMRDQKEVLTSIGIQLSYEPLQEQAKGLLYPYKQLQYLTDAELDLVKSGAEEVFYSFLLVDNTDRKRYRDLHDELVHAKQKHLSTECDRGEKND